MGGCKYRLNHARVQQCVTDADFEQISNKITWATGDWKK